MLIRVIIVTGRWILKAGVCPYVMSSMWVSGSHRKKKQTFLITKTCLHLECVFSFKM